MVAVDSSPSNLGQMDELLMSNPYSMVDNRFTQARADTLKAFSRQSRSATFTIDVTTAVSTITITSTSTRSRLTTTTIQQMTSLFGKLFRTLTTTAQAIYQLDFSSNRPDSDLPSPQVSECQSPTHNRRGRVGSSFCPQNQRVSSHCPSGHLLKPGRRGPGGQRFLASQGRYIALRFISSHA